MKCTISLVCLWEFKQWLHLRPPCNLDAWNRSRISRGGSSRKFLEGGWPLEDVNCRAPETYNWAATQGQLALRNLNEAGTRKTLQCNHDRNQSQLGGWKKTGGAPPLPRPQPKSRLRISWVAEDVRWKNRSGVADVIASLVSSMVYICDDAIGILPCLSFYVRCVYAGGIWLLFRLLKLYFLFCLFCYFFVRLSRIIPIPWQPVCLPNCGDPCVPTHSFEHHLVQG